MALLSACSADTGTLVVQVRTDFAPQNEFDTASVTLVGLDVDVEPRTLTRAASADRDWGRGVRVAEASGLPAGDYQLQVSLLDAESTRVVRPVRVALSLGSTTVVTVLLTRDCGGVMCPADGGDPTSVACLAGRCVDEGCTEETPELCAMPECTLAMDCVRMGEPPCVDLQCTDSGACFASPDHGVCAPDVCHATMGCVPTVGGLDGGVPGVPGELDVTFGDAGVTRVPDGGDNEFLALTLDTGGRIIAVGRSADAGLVMRFDRDGAFDRTFRTAEPFRIPAPGGGRMVFEDVEVADDGTITTVGTIDRAGAETAVIYRLNEMGNLDLTLAGSGFVEPGFALGYTAQRAHSVLLQQDGRIVISGGVGGSMDPPAVAFWRLMPNGSMDTSFSDDGFEWLSVGGGPLQTARSLTMRMTGEVVAGGFSDEAPTEPVFVYFGVDPSGMASSTSASSGFGWADTHSAVAMSGDRVAMFGFEGAAAGTGRFHFSVLAASGFVPDTSFAVSMLGADRNLSVGGGVVQRDGRLFAVGTVRLPGNANIAMARVLATGAPDTMLGGDGLGSLELGGEDEANDVAQQAGGRLIIAGRSNALAVVVAVHP